MQIDDFRPGAPFSARFARSGAFDFLVRLSNKNLAASIWNRFWVSNARTGRWEKIPTSRAKDAREMGHPAPTTLIVLGTSFENADRRHTACRVAGHNQNSLGVQNEESRDHPDIFVCGAPRLPWPEFWKDFQAFG
jgi:hypothetical protein